MLESTRLETFAKATSPSQEANVDIELFLKKYFLDATGQPDTAKTPQAIALHGLTTSSRNALYDSAQRSIRGLEMKSGGAEPDRVYVVGWDRNQVWRKARTFDAEVQRRRDEEASKERNAQMSKHEQYVIKNKSRSLNASTKVEHLAIGQYIIESDKISNGWGKQAMSLRISQHGSTHLVGFFDFGVINGIMHIGPDDKTLPHKELEGSRSSQSEQESDEETVHAGNKRKAPANSRKEQSTSKKQRVSPKHNRRLYLQWRGRDSGEGMIELDYDNSNVGHFEFTDSSCTSFEGVITIPAVGTSVPFQGFKISGIGGLINDSWSNYSEDVYEQERTGRWH